MQAILKVTQPSAGGFVQASDGLGTSVWFKPDPEESGYAIGDLVKILVAPYHETGTPTPDPQPQAKKPGG